MEASGSSSSSPGNSQDLVKDSEKVKPQKAPKIPKRLTKGKKKSSSQDTNPNPDPQVPDSPPNPTLKKSTKKPIKKPVAASKRNSDSDSSDNESESDRLNGPGHFGPYSNKENPQLFELYHTDEKFKLSDVSISQHVKLYDKKITKRMLELEEKNKVDKQVLSESLIHRILVTAEHETKAMINKLTDPNQHNPWAVPADQTDSRGKNRVTVIKLRWADLYNLVWGNNHTIKEMACNQVRNMRMLAIMHNLDAERLKAFFHFNKNRFNKIENEVKNLSRQFQEMSADVNQIKHLLQVLVDKQLDNDAFDATIKVEPTEQSDDNENNHDEDLPVIDPEDLLRRPNDDGETLSPFLHVDGGDSLPEGEDDDDDIQMIAFLDLTEDQEYAKLEKQRRDRLVNQLLRNSELKSEIPVYSLDDKKRLLKSLRRGNSPTNICEPVSQDEFKKQYNKLWKPNMTTLATFDPERARRDDLRIDRHTIKEEHNPAAKRARKGKKVVSEATPGPSGVKKLTKTKKSPPSGKKVRRMFIIESESEDEANAKDFVFETDDEDFEPPEKKAKMSKK